MHQEAAKGISCIKRLPQVFHASRGCQRYLMHQVVKGISCIKRLYKDSYHKDLSQVPQAPRGCQKRLKSHHEGVNGISHTKWY